MEAHNLIQVIEKSIKDHWELNAFSDYKVSDYTYGEVGQQILKLHSLYKSCGINNGDKVALIGKNSTNWAVIYLSTITYGATIVPVLADFHPENVQNIVNHSDAKLLFIDENINAKLDSSKFEHIHAIFSISKLEIIKDFSTGLSKACDKLDEVFANEYPGGINKQNFVLPKVDNSDIGVISYTSGTTGFSKGVMLPLASLMANVEFAWNNMPLDAEDKLLSILPLAHAFGGTFEFLWPFTVGVHTTFLGKMVSPQIMIQAFQEINPRLLLMVPLIMEKIYKKQLQPVLEKISMRVLLAIPLVNKLIYSKIKAKLSEVFGGNFREVVIGGAALNKDVEFLLRKMKFNYSVGYGMTECGPLISYANWDKTAMGSCGKLVHSLDITIDSPDPMGIPGEIMVKGTNVMLGYYKNQQETDKVIDKDGWLHTGDLGVVDKEGFIHIRGRSKCMILGPSGENIYPEEIESKLSNYPYVQEQLIIEDNHKLVALVFPDLEKAEKDGLNKQDLEKVMEENKKEVNKTLPKYSQIARIKIQDAEFEKTPKQSIKRFKYEIASSAS